MRKETVTCDSCGTEQGNKDISFIRVDLGHSFYGLGIPNPTAQFDLCHKCKKKFDQLLWDLLRAKCGPIEKKMRLTESRKIKRIKIND